MRKFLNWHDRDVFDDYDQYADYDYPELDDCPDPECDGQIVLMTEKNWGADRDGNRGIDISWRECNVCGEQPEGEGI